MPSFAACLYGSALYTPGPSVVRCFFEDCCESRFHLSRGSLLTSACLWVPEWSPRERKEEQGRRFDAHGCWPPRSVRSHEIGQFRGVDAVGVDEAAFGDLGEVPGQPAAAKALRRVCHRMVIASIDLFASEMARGPRGSTCRSFSWQPTPAPCSARQI